MGMMGLVARGLGAGCPVAQISGMGNFLCVSITLLKTFDVHFYGTTKTICKMAYCAVLRQRK